MKFGTLFMCAMLWSSFCFAANSPVTYHLSFETLDFMADDYVGKLSPKTPESRKLQLAEGRFGRALLMGAPSVPLNEDGYDHTYLDMITTVTIWRNRKNNGYEEPFLWGTGKLHPAMGSVAFWVKGPKSPCTVFEQTTTTWGRTERQLIEIHLERESSISAYVEDARYVQHHVRTQPFWKEDTWYHIVFMWDRSSGVELWVNGRKQATTMDNDAWWDNQKVGLFRLPMAGALYDEFFIMDRRLTAKEIENLYRNNTPPETRTESEPYDSAAITRLKAAFSPDTSHLPEAQPGDGDALVFTKITSERIDDEGVPGLWIDDGRYEAAWPFEYGHYTDTPGDVDFHAEKADMLPPAGVGINYVTLEGNLEGATVLKGDRNGNFENSPVIMVPGGTGFFYGALFDPVVDGQFRLPFTKEYGTPPGFKSDILKLPLSGNLRIHEAGMFNVSDETMEHQPGDRTLSICGLSPDISGTRYATALEALLPVIDRKSAGIYQCAGTGKPSTIVIAPMTRLNLFSEPWVLKECFNMILLDLWITSPVNDNILTVKLTNPALPSQTWGHAEVRLRGFSGKQSRLRLALRFDPVFLVPGDRIWLQLLATDGLTITMSNENHPATVVLRPELDRVTAEEKYSFRTMLPNRCTYSGMFEWMPWHATKTMPDADAPEQFGGPFDMVYPWQAVFKVNPGDRTAKIYEDFATGTYGNGGRPRDLSKIPHKTFEAPPNAPDWAVYFRELQRFRWNIITWWRHHQRSDGQVGGGWNDDTLVFSRGYSDLHLDSNPDALVLYNNVFDGLDKTNYYHDGYCRIWPIDDWHNGDFVRERYKSLVFNLGDPRSATWALEEAWHHDKPDKTPMNYGDGNAFLFGKIVLEWYWNKQQPQEPCAQKDREKLIGTIRQGADIVNETTLWRFTEAHVHTDDQIPYGSNSLHDMLNGGWSIPPGTYAPPFTIIVGVGWIQGGGPDLGRLVEYSGDDSLTISMYSFDAFDREVVMRLFRLRNGDYSVTLNADRDGDGRYETTIMRDKSHIKRFDRLPLTVPSRVPVQLGIKRLKADPDPGPLPDLAVSDYYVSFGKGTVRAIVHNIGCAPSGPFTVSVVDPGGAEIAKKRMDSLPSADDFAPKQAEVTFNGLPVNQRYTIVIDKDNAVEEIYEENNTANAVSK